MFGGEKEKKGKENIILLCRLIAEIKFFRPDLLQNVVTSCEIAPNPPLHFFKPSILTD